MNWKILGSVEGGEVLIADDTDAERIKVSYPETLSMASIESLLELKDWSWGQLEDIKPGPSEGEMIASFTYPD